MDIFEGSLKKRNVHHRPVEWESGDFKLGMVEDTGMFTAVNIRIPLLTVEWPQATLMITFKNKNFVFCRTWPDDIDDFADWLKIKAQEARDNSQSIQQKSDNLYLLKQAAEQTQNESEDLPSILGKLGAIPPEMMDLLKTMPSGLPYGKDSDTIDI